MEDGASVSVTRLLQDWNDGDQAALERLVPLIYDELRGIAERRLHNERRDHTLQATALVNEAYLKLVDQKRVRWTDRAHFFSVAAHVMRRLLVDHARRHLSDKRGAGIPTVPLDQVLASTTGPSIDLVALDAAIERLTTLDARQGRIVELRFFGGFTIAETATLLGVSPATVKTEWALARAWLYRELTE